MKKRILACFLVVVLGLGLFSTSAFAAGKNVCPQVRGTTARTQTFVVETGSRWLFKDKITLTQDKGTYLFTGWLGRDKYVSMYGMYNVTYQKEGSNEVKEKTWTGRSLTLKLDQNSTYIITIRPYDTSAIQATRFIYGAVRRWTTNACWWIKSTKGITLCS